ANVANMQEVVQLQQRLAQLEKQITALANTPQGSQTQQQTQTRPARATSRKRTYDIPFERIRNDISEAKKATPEQIRNHWGAFLEQLRQINMPAYAIVQDSKPVAASTSALIVSFKYEIHCSLFMEHKEVVESVLANSLAHHSIIPIPEEDWHRLRKQYIAEHNQGKKQPEQEQEEEVSDPVVDEAKKLFGDDIVEIRE